MKPEDIRVAERWHREDNLPVGVTRDGSLLFAESCSIEIEWTDREGRYHSAEFDYGDVDRLDAVANLIGGLDGDALHLIARQLECLLP